PRSRHSTGIRLPPNGRSPCRCCANGWTDNAHGAAAARRRNPLTGEHKIRHAPATKRVNRASKTGVKSVDTEISGQTHTLRKNSMNKLLMTLCAFAFAATA